jgi:hypothetical protein
VWWAVAGLFAAGVAASAAEDWQKIAGLFAIEVATIVIWTMYRRIGRPEKTEGNGGSSVTLWKTIATLNEQVRNLSTRFEKLVDPGELREKLRVLEAKAEEGKRDREEIIAALRIFRESGCGCDHGKRHGAR